MFGFDLTRLLYVVPAIVLALSIHEYAHARVAYAFGDSTARDAGRLTLNPLKHLDVVGTLTLIFVGFGWAKPVPINPWYFGQPRKLRVLWVSLAGPASNILQALLGTGIIAVFWHFVHDPGELAFYFFMLLNYYVSINLSLAFFNLIPIPPLDGSKILASLLPDRHFNIVLALERYGFLILMLLCFLPNILSWLGLPAIDPLSSLISVPAAWLRELFFSIFGIN
ncbi:MAG: site-2 protease family protein [Bacillota bacterium]|nr:site-2 protease family protein [Bacillota bacterium]